MKKIFLLGLLFPFSVFAQSFDFEFQRSNETPGYFSLRIFPTPDAVSFSPRNVFVRNYASQNASFYAPIEQFILDQNETIIDLPQLLEYSSDLQNRIVFLGKGNGGFLHFVLQQPENSLEDFLQFREKSLRPVYLRHIQFSFGGNVKEVSFPVAAELTDQPFVLLGQFAQPMKTRMEITAQSFDGDVIAIEPLPFDQDSFVSSSSEAFVSAWETSLNAQKSSEEVLFSLPEPKSIFDDFSLSSFLSRYTFVFPVFFLLVLGFVVLFLVFQIRTYLRHHHMISSASEEDLLVDDVSPVLSAKMDEEISDSIPFRIERKTNPSATIPDAPFSLDSRTPEILPSEQMENKNSPLPNQKPTSPEQYLGRKK